MIGIGCCVTRSPATGRTGADTSLNRFSMTRLTLELGLNVSPRNLGRRTTTPFNLSSGQNKVLEVSFTPDAVGSFSALLTIESDSGNAVVNLTGVPESISNIPQDIDVVDSDDNIVVAFVSSEQINQLAQLDFVEKIAPPIQATVSPIPISADDNQIDDTTLMGVGIVIVIAIIAGIVYSKKRRVITS